MVFELLHTPPACALSKSVIAFTQTFIVPVIEERVGKGFTLKLTGPKEAIQPAEVVTTTDTWPPVVSAGGHTFDGPLDTSIEP